MSTMTLARDIAYARPWPLLMLLLAISGVCAQWCGLAAPDDLSGPSFSHGVTLAAAAIAVCAAILQVRLDRAQHGLAERDGLRRKIADLHDQLRAASAEATARLHAEAQLADCRRRLTDTRDALEQRLEELRRTREEAVVGIAHFDRSGRLVLANEMFRKQFGYSEDELAGMSSEDLTHPSDIPRSLEVTLRLRGGYQESASLEKRYVRKDGRVFAGSTKLAVVRGSDGEVDCVISQIEDVSPRNDLRRQLERARAFLATVVESDQNPTVLLENGDRVLLANQAFLGNAPRPAEVRPGAAIGELLANLREQGRAVRTDEVAVPKDDPAGCVVRLGSTV